MIFRDSYIRKNIIHLMNNTGSAGKAQLRQFLTRQHSCLERIPFRADFHAAN